MRISDWSSDVCSSDLAFVTTMDDGSPVFANVEIKGRMVTLAVNSAGRAAKGRAELAAHLGNLVGTPLTEIRTLEQMLADERSEERRRGKECVRPIRSGWSPYH